MGFIDPCHCFCGDYLRCSKTSLLNFIFRMTEELEFGELSRFHSLGFLLLMNLGQQRPSVLLLMPVLEAWHGLVRRVFPRCYERVRCSCLILLTHGHTLLQLVMKFPKLRTDRSCSGKLCEII